MTQIQRTDK